MRRTLTELGREQIKETKQANREAATVFRIGEAIQFYKDGWRYGHVKEIGVGKLRSGQIKIEHPITGDHWASASDVRQLAPMKAKAMRELEKPCYTVEEVGELMALSRRSVIRLFEREKGVIILSRPSRMNKRRYRSIRIPRVVYQRVCGQLST